VTDVRSKKSDRSYDHATNILNEITYTEHRHCSLLADRLHWLNTAW